jgi:tetratricopeptide (TPR) repeat protein
VRALPFVGRETQVAALVSAVQAAELGERVIGMVAGEPGIGKSRLVEEMAARVASEVLWAGCWEGDGAPSYWVWRQLLRALGGEAVLAEAGGETRFGLFDAVAEFFARASQERPLVLVIEDLHWADEASVRLLEFLAHDRRPRRLAIIGTYRDTDLDRSHPFARGLGDLVRDGLHLALGGLGTRDVGSLVAAMGLAAGDQVNVLHRRSGGNPFFLRELVRLAQEAPASTVPAGVRPVVARRVQNLAPATQEVLTTAAVAGEDFDVPLLGAVTGATTGGLLAALDEARVAGLVEEAGGRFRFVHALVRESLYDGLGLAARAALHRRLAEVLDERFGDARLPEIAAHALHGAVAGGDDRALDWAVRAGERSFELLAYEESAAWYGRALDILPAGGDETRRGRLLQRRGQAYLAAGDLPAARDAYRQAADVARRSGDAGQLARAALGLGAGFGGFEVRLFDPVQVELLEEALAALGPGPSLLRAWVLARLSVALSFMDAEGRRLTLSEEAVAMARQVGDPAVLGYALAGHCDVIPGPNHCQARLSEAGEVVRLARDAGDRPLELLGRRLRVVALLETGQVEEADFEIDRFAQVADQIRQPLYRWYVPLWRGMRALMRGEPEAAARQCAIAEDIGALAHSDNARVLTFTQWWVRSRYEGRFDDINRATADLAGSQPMTPAGWPYPVVLAAQRGELSRARRLFEQWLGNGLARRPRDSEWLPDSAQLAEVAVLAGCRPVAELLYSELRPYADLFCIEGIGAACTGSVSWYLSLLARFLDRREEAAAYEAQAKEAHRRVGFAGDPPPLMGAGPAPAAAGPAGAAMVCEGATWALTFAGSTCRVRDGKGVRDLAVLLARPGEDVHCLELVGGADVGRAGGPAVDQQARRAYERRIRDLQSDIDDARAANDPARAERAEIELDALVQQLAEAFGLSGRARATGSAAERARSAVGWRVRAALRQVADAHPPLGRHLQNAVRTGTWCSYRPETPVGWQIDQGRSA